MLSFLKYISKNSVKKIGNIFQISVQEVCRTWIRFDKGNLDSSSPSFLRERERVSVRERERERERETERERGKKRKKT